ncbi:MFS transporter [Gordonia jinghuaiqii]|uniref:MFS transporter n=1 Tax=Gordonia jinghuaiqii TaxID=2758710 RepID=A0A7D7LXM3_9ACTN|nr:MFS transporter [Gordonia jinghuaiqii]MCR5977602.1 MFS transporter [Gordonia jinghuaiqii]QMT02279.1 MFS transporter [Gordonia jinghuaiqii]
MTDDRTPEISDTGSRERGPSPTPSRPGRSDTFASLRNANYRIYYGGMAVSMTGSWMQATAQAWLVLSLSGSASVLGLVVALQALPVLLIGPYAGVIADRVDRRRLLIAVQAMMGLLAAILAAITLAGVVQVWHVGILAVLLGLGHAFEQPARQAFIHQIVGMDLIRNAVTLNSVLMNAARAVGPAVAGIILTLVGAGWCFTINALSFVAVIASLVALDASRITPESPVARAKGQLREGLTYVRGNPALWIPLATMALVGCFAYNFPVTLPAAADFVFDGGPQALGFMTSAMGVGAVFGGLVVAARGTTGLRPLTLAAIGFGVTLAVAALAPNLPTVICALFLVGWLSVTFMSTGNATLQLNADPQMRGRVMALWSVAFMGSTPIGGPIIGAIIEATSARVGLAVGAAACLVAALMALLVHRHTQARTAATR